MRLSTAGEGTGSSSSSSSSSRCYRQCGTRLETRMQQVPTDTKRRMPSSRVLEEVIHQAPAEYVTVGWLTSTLHRQSFGIIMLSLGLLAMTPVGSTVPTLILAIMAAQLIVGRADIASRIAAAALTVCAKRMRWPFAAAGCCCAASGSIYRLYRDHGRGRDQQPPSTGTGERRRPQDDSECRRRCGGHLYSRAVVRDGFPRCSEQRGGRAAKQAAIPRIPGSATVQSASPAHRHSDKHRSDRPH